MNHHLENYYSGDSAWNQLVSLYEDLDTNNSLTKELLQQLNYHRDIAQVIWGKFGSSSLSVITQPVPALDNLSIADCIAAPNLLQRLRECLIRMEWPSITQNSKLCIGFYLLSQVFLRSLLLSVLAKEKKQRVPRCTYGTQAFCSALLWACPYWWRFPNTSP